RRRPGGAVRAHRVPGRTTGRWTMSTALAAPPAGTYYDTAVKTRAIRPLPAAYVATDEPVAPVPLLGPRGAARRYHRLPALGRLSTWSPTSRWRWSPCSGRAWPRACTTPCRDWAG